MDIHILDVGCGSMAMIINPDGTKVVLDCNITTENCKRVLEYVSRNIGKGSPIDIFINSHRDADHMRGIADLHAQNPIRKIMDTEVPGTTTDSAEYVSYMRLRRSVDNDIIEAGKYYTIGGAKYRCMNAQREGYSDANQQSVVLKIEYKVQGCSVMFAGDTDYRPWKEKIIPQYQEGLKSAILIAAHHGSISFFDDPADKKNYYADHLKKINPDVTIVSVGPNQNSLPDKKALELYEKYSTGTVEGIKLYLTQDVHNIKITLTENGDQILALNQ